MLIVCARCVCLTRSVGECDCRTFAVLWLTMSPMTPLDWVCCILMVFVSGFNGQFYMRQVALAAGKAGMK